MKKIAIIASLLVATMGMAQENTPKQEGERQEMQRPPMPPTAEERLKQMTTDLNLNADQQKKVAKWLEKEDKQRQKRMGDRPPMPPKDGQFGEGKQCQKPPQDGQNAQRPPMQSQDGQKTEGDMQRPPMPPKDGQRPEGDIQRPPMPPRDGMKHHHGNHKDGKDFEKGRKQQEKADKKLKKILTAEQYQKFQEKRFKHHSKQQS